MTFRWPARHGDQSRQAWSALRLSVHRDRFEFEIGHEQEVDNVESVVRLHDDDGATAGCRHHKLTMQNRNATSISHMNSKRLEWLLIVSFSNSFDGHRWALSGSQNPRFRNRIGGLAQSPNRPANAGFIL